MYIRHAVQEDLENIMPIYDRARRVMYETGNKTQWSGAYPSNEDISEDIRRQQCYLCAEKEDTGNGNTEKGNTENEKILAVFAFIIGEEPTYAHIENGAWSREEPYGTIHRIASSGLAKGAADFCYDFCKKQISYLRADTHKDNALMQKSLTKNGFSECGIIYVRDKSPRIAYEYCGKK